MIRDERYTEVSVKRASVKAGHRRAVVAGALALGALFGSAAPAAAQDSPRERAEEIMSLTYAEFAEVAARREKPFDWSTDGCTALGAPNLGNWQQVFRPACVQHDFGYRNFGRRGELDLDPTEARRTWIDDRFLVEMRRICSDTGQGLLSTCHLTAQVVHGGVRNAGGVFFF